MPRVILPVILLAALLAAVVGAQNPPQAAGPGQPGTATPAWPTLAAGAIIPAELSKSLDAKKNKAGDKVEAKTATDLLAHGQIVLPRNTKIVGHVTEAKARNKDSQDSTLAITFDHILYKDGHEMPIQVVVQAIGRPLQAFGMGSESSSESAGNLGPVAPAGVGGTMGGASGASGPGGMGGPQPQYPGNTRPESPDPSMTRPSSGSTTVAPLGPTSEGAVGMKGLTLSSSGQGAAISSSTQNVHLDGGSQLILKTQ
jgi:hypothetical protein